MATNAITALGTTLTFDTETLGEVQSLTGNRTCNVVDVLSVSSTNSTIEKLAGAINEGDITVHIVYDGSAAGIYNVMNTKFIARTNATLLLTLSDTSAFSGSAIMSSLGVPGFGVSDGFVELDISFALTGQVTFTDVAA